MWVRCTPDYSKSPSIMTGSLRTWPSRPQHPQETQQAQETRQVSRSAPGQPAPRPSAITGAVLSLALRLGHGGQDVHLGVAGPAG